MPEVKPISKDFRTGLSVGVIVGCVFGIAYLIMYGNPENSLHVSALAWFFLTGLLTLAGAGVVALTPYIIEAWRAK